MEEDQDSERVFPVLPGKHGALLFVPCHLALIDPVYTPEWPSGASFVADTSNRTESGCFDEVADCGQHVVPYPAYLYGTGYG